MLRRPYKRPKTDTGDLRTPVIFYEYAPNDGPEPGEAEKVILYRAWAKVDSVWLKDVELAKSTGTLSDLTITIRDTQGGYIPRNEHYLSVDAPEYVGSRYNIKHVEPDMQNKKFTRIVAGMVVT